MRLLRRQSFQIQQFKGIGSPSAIRTTCPDLPDEGVSLILSDKSSKHITHNGFFHSEPASKTKFTIRFPHLSESITRDSIEESKLNSIDSIDESPLSETLSLSRHETRDSIEESTDKTQSKLNSIDSIHESPSETLSHSHTYGTLTSPSRLNGSANHHHRYEEFQESLTRDSIEESTHESTLNSIDSIYESPSETLSHSHTYGTLTSPSRLNGSANHHRRYEEFQESLTRDSIEESTHESTLNWIDSIYESPSETLSHSHTYGTLTSPSRLNGSAIHHRRYKEFQESLTRDSIEESTHESTLDSIDSIYESPSETVSRSNTGRTLTSRHGSIDSSMCHNLHTASDCFVDWDGHDVLLTPPPMQYISPIRLNSHLHSPVSSSSMLQMMNSIEQIRNAVNDLVRNRAEEDSLELGPARKYLKPAGKYCARQLRNAVVDFICQNFCTWLVAIVFGAAAAAILKKQFFKA